MCNIDVTVEEPDLARAHSYVVLHTGETGDIPTKVTATLIGDFHDVLVPCDGAWRIHQRIGSLALRMP